MNSEASGAAALASELTASDDTLALTLQTLDARLTQFAADGAGAQATIVKLDAALVEMKRSKKNGLCCGAGGAQMFKEAEPGSREVNVERSEEALAASPNIIAAGCPFCNTMLTDGVKHFNKEGEVVVKDIAELIAEAGEL